MLVPDEQMIITKAKQCLQRSNYLGEVNNLTRLVNLYPDNPDYHFQLADAYHQLLKVHFIYKYYVNALNHYCEAINLAPQEASYYAKRAELYLIKRLRYKAFKDLSRAIKRDPDNISYYQQRAPLASELGKISIAIRDYQRLLRADPEDISLLPKIEELRQRLPANVAVSPVSTQASQPIPTPSDSARDALNSLLTQRRRAKFIKLASIMTLAVSGLALIAGIVLSSLGLLTIGLSIVGIASLGCTLSTASAIYHQRQQRSFARQLEAEALPRVPPQQITNYATFGYQPTSSTQQELRSIQVVQSEHSSDDFTTVPGSAIKNSPS